jgi:hypothetical protein
VIVKPSGCPVTVSLHDHAWFTIVRPDGVDGKLALGSVLRLGACRLG